jgi:lysozyme
MLEARMSATNLCVVDLYHGDVVTSFARAKSAGIRGIIHKASQGVGVTDPAYAARRQEATAAGLLWGAYHFATDEDAAAQAHHFLACAAPDAHTLLALDFETNGNHTMSLAQARAFLAVVDGVTARKCVLYSGNLIKEQLGDRKDSFFAAHRLWLAEYGSTAKVPKAWSKYWLWQYSGDGIGPGPHAVMGIPGTGGALDCNSYAGTPEQLAAEWAS